MRFCSVSIVVAMVLVSACTGDKLDCGEGTHEYAGECIPDHDHEADTSDAEEVEYERFNCVDDATQIFVGAAEEVEGDACGGRERFALRHAPCEGDEIEVGEAYVSPCDGPVGTSHIVVVQIYSIYRHEVDHAAFRLDGPAGVLEVELVQDSADWDLFRTTFTSEGPAGAVTLGVGLWAIPDDDSGSPG
jgi:hypothetical protein